MVGQGRPSAWKVFGNRFAFGQNGLGLSRIFLSALVLACFYSALSPESFAAEKTVRLRLAWGSGNGAKQRWTGKVSIDGGVLSELQPLGIETDAPVALRIDGSQLMVAPLEKRGFDGCDVMVRADEQALVRVELRSEQMQQAVVFEAPLSEVLRNQLSQPLDELGSFFLARRSPGDVLRVVPTREHLVFDPGEKWNLQLQPDLAKELAAGTVLIDVQLRATSDSKPSWRSSQQIHDATQLESGLDFEIVCPATEGVYRLTVTARPEEGFASRFVPGQQSKAFATRDIEFVVIDPQAKLPRLFDQWLPVLTIDPANPHWWQRLPTWAQVPRLRDRHPGAIGNVRPVVRPMSTGDLVELPPVAAGSDPSWQSYTLPVREPGEPHLIEIEYPLGVQQHLAISIVEPDAAGRVTTTQQDGSLFSDGLSSSASDGKVGVHRFIIWPRTRSPQLLIVNQHPTKPGQYGKIKLLKQDTAMASLAVTANPETGERLVAGYLAQPLLASSFGAAELLDPNSGLSVHSWSTFLDGTRRLAQTLRLKGYNGVLLSVAADGSGLYPSRVINPSPRYDTGLLSASGQDPQRKDVLEMLLRVFDREGIRVFPTVQLAAPLPRLERLRLGNDVRTSGIGCVGYNGQCWLEENPTSEGLAPFYNPLNDQVQAELVALVAELTTRYGNHTSMSGVGVQLSGEGYGLMPGLSWGFDDRTVASFSQATGIATPNQGPDRFNQRAELLLGEQRLAWQEWRTGKLSQLYTRLAQPLAANRSDLRLVLTTENVFTGQELQQRVRQAIANTTDFSGILLDHGLDLTQLNAQPNITALNPHRLSLTGQLQAQATDLRVNSAAEQGDILATRQRSAELLFHTTSHFHLPSFDARSPFGAAQTYLTVSTQPHSAGIGQRQQILTAIAGNDPLMIVDGGERLSQNLDSQTRDLLRVFKQLPYAADSNGLTQRQQPVVMRAYRVGQQTYVAMVNESPWPVKIELVLTGSRNSEWSKLASQDGPANTPESLAGTMTNLQQIWQIELQPYALQAWRFEDEKLRIGELKITQPDIAKLELKRRIAEIESRTGNLRIKRPYSQLQNPDFEFEDRSEGIAGWRKLQGDTGVIRIENTGSHSGAKTLRLKSEDPTGVAVQSNLFAAPETGQLLVGVHLRFDRLAPTAQLQIAVQDSSGGRRYNQSKQLGDEQSAGKGWAYYEFALGDVPLGQEEQLQIQFHLRGSGEVLIDNVQLYDLQFSDARRRALVKRLFAANIALEQGQVVDCLRVVDDYWSQYLVEYVPAAEQVTAIAARPQNTVDPTTKSPTEAEKNGIGSRLRDWVPSRWR